MSWICPYCGAENYRMPVNSRHTPRCTGCGEDFITPDDLEKQIEPQIKAAEADLKADLCVMQEACDHCSSLRDELSSWEQKRNDALKDMENDQTELTKLKNVKIFREVDREARSRLDRAQAKLPLEEARV